MQRGKTNLGEEKLHYIIKMNKLYKKITIIEKKLNSLQIKVFNTCWDSQAGKYKQNDWERYLV